MMRLELPKIYPVASHTDNVGYGSTFVAIAGLKDNGTKYISLAIEKGATTIVVQEGTHLPSAVIDDMIRLHINCIYVENSRKALSQMIAKALDYPAKKLKIIAITGTKGKTSTSYMIYHLLRQQHKKVALISTAEKFIDGHLVAMDLTTPLPEHLHIFFNACVQKNIEYVVMEVSAQSLSLYRVYDLQFDVGVFTNFSLEHLEFYKSMQEYLDAKVMLLSMIKDQSNMLINKDDEHGAQLLSSYKNCRSFSLHDVSASYYATVSLGLGTITLQLAQNDLVYTYTANLVGAFNASNLLSAVAAVHSLGFSLQDIEKTTLSLGQIPGRMEQYPLKNGATCFIDYAHNPSSYQAVLSTLKGMTDHLIVVFGAGGDRDKSKRPIMGSLVESYANIAIVTSDNPRNESAAAIAENIIAGFKGRDNFRYIQELNRTAAIQLAYELSHEGSIIAVLGKGRDEYQIVGHMTFPFKERAIIRSYLREDSLYKNL